MDKPNNKIKKERVHYNVMFVPDKVSAGVKHFSIKLDMLLLIVIAIVFIVVASVAYGIILTGEVSKANEHISTLSSEIESLTEEKASIEDENEVLQEKVSILSSTINEKVQQQEQLEAEIAQSYIPNRFPLKGTASYNEDETELDGNPIALFHASEGTSVISSANGTVESIEKSGDTYVVTINHDNGYKSIYRNGTQPKVSEGDEVTSETEIFRITAGYEELGYQIIENDTYIDPLGLMEIYG